jgi:DNA-binding NtrC family response regulator
LQKAGYRAVPSYSAADAISLMSALAFDVVLSDIVLGSLSGIDVAIAARKLLPKCRVLLISGNHNAQELLDRAKEEGNEFVCLAKPLPPDELLAQIAAEHQQLSKAEAQPKTDAGYV